MIYPKPKEEKYFEGVCKIPGICEYKDVLSLYSAIKNGCDGVTVLHCADYGNEEYSVEVTSDGITVSCSSDCGIFRAASSLIQLIKQNGTFVPLCSIRDFPDFENRGYMLDISRGRMPKREFIAFLIDLLASLKYNEFQLYMEGIVYHYDAYPHCSEGMECLDKDDIKYLDEYCRERFIKFVPNQNSFGHMSGWLNRDEFLHLKVGPKEDDTGNLNPSATLNPLLPESLEFMDNIYSSLLPYFSSDYVNIGLDEAFGMGTYELEEPCKKYGNDNVFMDWLCKLSELTTTKYGKKVQFWADMIYNYPNAYKRLPEGAIPLVWGYDIRSNSFVEKRCADLHAKGLDYYVCPGDGTWVALTGRFDVAQVNMRIFAEMGRKYGAKGYLLTNWGSGYSAHFPVQTVVPCTLGAQYAWGVSTYNIGWYMNSDALSCAESFADDNVFGMKISKYLRRLQRYYLLEPERVHCATIAGVSIGIPLNQKFVFNDFDMEKYSQPYQFEDVITYVRSALSKLEEIPGDNKWKKQAICNAKMVIFVSEINIIRITHTTTDAKLDEIKALADELCLTFEALWNEENYPSGMETVTGMIRSRANEAQALRGGKRLVFTQEADNKTKM